MKKTVYLSIIIIVAVVVFTGICFSMRNIFSDNDARAPNVRSQTAVDIRPFTADNAPNVRIAPHTTESPEHNLDKESINAYTRIIYEYYYEVDDTIIRTEEAARYFQIGLNADELAEVHKDWDIISFSDKEVVLRKNIEVDPEQTYIVSVLDGYITVFYGEGMRVKEVTSTPITTLSQNEQERLMTGIPVVGEMNLIKLMEDYGS